MVKESQTSFEFLKESLTTVLLLPHPDTSKSYIFYTDASEECIGACLCEVYDDDIETKPGTPSKQHIYFLSYRLTATQTKWPWIEKEAYAIFCVLQMLDEYLHDSEFEITDHSPLRLLLFMEYIKGKKDVCDDIFSHQAHMFLIVRVT